MNVTRFEAGILRESDDTLRAKSQSRISSRAEQVDVETAGQVAFGPALVESFEAAILVQHVDRETACAEELDNRLRSEAHLAHCPRRVLDGDHQMRAGRDEGSHAFADWRLVAFDVDLHEAHGARDPALAYEAVEAQQPHRVARRHAPAGTER